MIKCCKECWKNDILSFLSMNDKKLDMSKADETFNKHYTNTPCKEHADMYNGWKNYETWSIALFIDNEVSWYNNARGIAQSTAMGDYDKVKMFSEWMGEEMITDNLTSYQMQMITAFLSEVDWREVIKHYQEE